MALNLRGGYIVGMRKRQYTYHGIPGEQHLHREIEERRVARERDQDWRRRNEAFRELQLCGMYLRLAFLELRGE